MQVRIQWSYSIFFGLVEGLCPASFINTLCLKHLIIFAPNKKKLKTFIKYILQGLFGFERYLFVFSIFKVFTLKWDKDENHFFHFMAMLPQQGNILDIGANIGIMSTTLARKFPMATIHAFEPLQSNANALNSVTKYFKLTNVIFHQVALGNENGSIKMIMPVVNNVKFQGLSHVVHDSIDDIRAGDTFDVPIYRLDDFGPLKLISNTITGIKMDVENFEQFVVKGGLELITKHQPVLYIELWISENRDNCIATLLTINYIAHTLVNNKLELFDASIHHHHNLFFLYKV